MRYHHLQPIDRQVALAIFATNDVIRISDALVCLAFHDSDRIWVEQWCFQMTQHADPGVRSTAAICLGHLARIHGTLDLVVAIPLLKTLQEHPATVGQADDALNDIDTFILKRCNIDNEDES